MYKSKELSIYGDWKKFIIRHMQFELPIGSLVTSNDIEVAHQILKYAGIVEPKGS